jgi:hypothetical protein
MPWKWQQVGNFGPMKPADEAQLWSNDGQNVVLQAPYVQPRIDRPVPASLSLGPLTHTHDIK